MRYFPTSSPEKGYNSAARSRPKFALSNVAPDELSFGKTLFHCVVRSLIFGPRYR